MNKTLTQGFTRFLRRRRAKKHFERQPLLDALTAKAAVASAGGSGVMDLELLQAARDTPAQALARLQSRVDGLDATERALRLTRDGPNEVAHEAPLPGWLRLWRCYLNPFNLLLSALALLSLLSSDAKATVVVGVMVALGTVIRFVQEGRSQRAAEGLRALVGNTATVLRRAPKTASAVSAPASESGPATAQQGQEIHGIGPLATAGCARRLFQTDGLTNGLLRLADRDLSGLLHADDDNETHLYKTLWVAEMVGDRKKVKHLFPLCAAFDLQLTPRLAQQLSWMIGAAPYKRYFLTTLS